MLDGAALTHDVGSLISYADHHVHSAYLIGNADLLGFDQRETAVMASTALLHRKAKPGAAPWTQRPTRRGRPQDGAHAEHGRCASQNGWTAVTPACAPCRLEAGSSRRELVLRLATEGPAHLELWGLEKQRGSIERSLRRRLTIETTTSLGGPASTDPRPTATLASAEDRGSPASLSLP